MAKSAPSPKAASQPSALELFQRNLAAMRVWYRRAATPGPEAGVNVIHELVLANVMTALELAIAGKQWVEPAHNP